MFSKPAWTTVLIKTFFYNVKTLIAFDDFFHKISKDIWA